MVLSQWYVIIDGRERGPLSSRQVKELIQVGQLTASSLIRTAHSSDHVDVARIREFNSEPARPAADSPAEPGIAHAGTTPDPAAVSPTADDLFENYGPTPRRTPSPPDYYGSPGPAIPSRGDIPLRTAATPAAVASLLATPDWHHLWPLATLTLVMGWIIGGFLGVNRLFTPQDAMPVAILALGGVPLACAAMLYYLRPRRVPIGTAIATCLFTGTIGIILLLCLQFAASLSTHGFSHIHGRGVGIWAVLAAIGTAYDLTHSANIIARWFGFVFGVGLCEETTKLLPLVMLILRGSDRRMSLHAFLFLGFVSGIGFGVGEALYCYAPWTGNIAYGSNLIRWYSAVPSHAIYTTMCAAFLWKLADSLTYADTFWGKAAVVGKAAGAMAVVHGTYDTVCSLGIIPSLAMAALSFVLLIMIVEWTTAGATEPPDQAESGWVPRVLNARTMTMGLGGSIALLALAMFMASRPEVALPAILRAQLPPAYHPYIVGVSVTPEAPATAHAPAVSARFQVSVIKHAIVGTFTNVTDATLHHLVITCDNSGEQAHRAFVIGDLAAHAATVIDPHVGWSFEPQEQVTIVADGQPAYQLTLP